MHEPHLRQGWKAPGRREPAVRSLRAPLRAAAQAEMDYSRERHPNVRWDGYDPLIDEIRNLGYRVRTQVLDAADFGVPQTRRRLFLLCDRETTPDPVSLPG